MEQVIPQNNYNSTENNITKKRIKNTWCDECDYCDKDITIGCHLKYHVKDDQELIGLDFKCGLDEAKYVKQSCFLSNNNIVLNV